MLSTADPRPFLLCIEEPAMASRRSTRQSASLYRMGIPSLTHLSRQVNAPRETRWPTNNGGSMKHLIPLVVVYGLEAVIRRRVLPSAVRFGVRMLRRIL